MLDPKSLSVSGADLRFDDARRGIVRDHRASTFNVISGSAGGILGRQWPGLMSRIPFVVGESTDICPCAFRENPSEMENAVDFDSGAGGNFVRDLAGDSDQRVGEFGVPDSSRCRNDTLFYSVPLYLCRVH